MKPHLSRAAIGREPQRRRRGKEVNGEMMRTEERRRERNGGKTGGWGEWAGEDGRGEERRGEEGESAREGG